MAASILNKIEYLVLLVAAFAAQRKISEAEAYCYLNRVGAQITRYKQGYITFDEFLRRIQHIKGITFQYAFCTQRAIDKLIKNEATNEARAERSLLQPCLARVSNI